MAQQRDDTLLGGSDRRFPTTEWTRIGDPRRRQAILAELCERYWKPLYAYLRVKGFSNEDAKDMVQGFFSERVLGQEFITRIDRTKGRFRNFLLVALRNYVINLQKKRTGSLQVEATIEELPALDDAEAEFNRVWADALLDQALGELETECRRKGRSAQWQLFQDWLLDSDIDPQKKEMAQLCAKHGFRDATQGYKVVFRMKMRFRDILRRRFRTLADSEDEVDLEIGEFISIFSKQ